MVSLTPIGLVNNARMIEQIHCVLNHSSQIRVQTRFDHDSDTGGRPFRDSKLQCVH